MYDLFRLGATVVPRLPRWSRPLLPRLIAPLAWLAGGDARRQATINATHVLGPDAARTAAGRRKIRRTVRGVFFNAISNYLDLFAAPAISGQEVLRRVQIRNEEYVIEALAEGKGVILVSAHFGPFESLGSAFTARGLEVVVPVEKLRDERLLQLTTSLRKMSGVKLVPVDGLSAMRAILDTLGRNQIALILADRAIVGPSAVMDFFGAPARMPTGPVALSLRTGAPLVGGFGWRTSATTATGEFTRITFALPEDQRTNADALQAEIIAQMERFIGAYPEQWAVFEPVWVQNSVPAAADP